jgi:hypothetical protein
MASTARAQFAPAPAPATPRTSTRPPPAVAGTTVAPRAPAAAVIGATLPGTRPVPTARPSARRSTTRPSPVTRLLRWALRVLGLARAGASHLNAQDKRLIALALIALLILGARQDPNAVAQIEAPTAMPAAAAAAGAPSAAPSGGGMVDDPTSKGRVTATTAHGLAEIRAHFGPAIRSASCWDEHAWNPKSDHPRGRACDVYTSPAREFAKGDGLTNGNRVAAWLREHHQTLGVAYVIWQGRIWSPSKGDRPYGGGGVYDASDAIGGHFDHLHISFER